MARSRLRGDYEETMEQEEQNQRATCVVAVVSVLFVAVFGAALVGGIVSGDPSNGYFITIIVASTVVIAIATVLSFQHFCGDNDYDEADLKSIRGTFTHSEEEEIDEEQGYDRHGAATSINARIKEIKPRSVAGDVSALSPNSFDYSFTTRESRDFDHRSIRKHRRARGGKRGLFDFASVASSRNAARSRREDPPDGPLAAQMDRPRCIEPSGPKATTAGNFIMDEGASDVGDKKPSNTKSDDFERDTGKPSKSKSQGKRNKKTLVPSISKSSKSESAARLKRSKTPTASEVGSTVSSVLLKPFNGFFGKKRPASQVGSEGEGKPQKSDSRRSDLSTINVSDDDRRVSHTTRRNSPISATGMPSPSGSRAHSELKSTVGSSVFSTNVASSTFDPVSRDLALQHLYQNPASLGARRINDMPIYYEEEEDSVAQSSVARTSSVGPTSGVGAAYDVFAPPGPLGLVVDRKETGCIVHSLKKTSCMRGLINPGDLIFALDDFDVRNLDASSLTKLMAKKSKQKARKFTFLPLQN